MEVHGNGMNNYHMLRDTEDHAMEIFERMDRNIKAELNRGMVWRILASETTDDMVYSIKRLAAATLTDHPNGSDNVSPTAREGSGHNLISGVGFRCIGQGDICHWDLVTIWDSVEINHITVCEDYEWRPDVSYYGESGTRMSMEENITVWWRMIKDWNRPDGNVLSIQILWSGSFSYSEQVLQLLEDVNSSNSVQIICEQFTLHPQLREQYIARHGTNRVGGAYSVLDSCETVTISYEFVATKGGDGDGDGLLCAICYEMISIGKKAKQLPCSHLFHRRCILTWLHRRLSCPLCRYEYQ